MVRPFAVVSMNAWRDSESALLTLLEQIVGLGGFEPNDGSREKVTRCHLKSLLVLVGST